MRMGTRAVLSGAILAIVVVVALYTLWFMATPHNTSPLRTITIGSTTFQVEVADTESARERGLGERASLPEGRGMLFVFDTPGSQGIWMKDMRFPLDIIWARADGTITTIERNVATSTYPEAFYSKTPDALYVVELNAGAANGVAEGEKITL
jgi:uncharacterized protein